MPSRCPNSRSIVANIVSRSASLLTSARMARLPAPSVALADCSVRSFKPQMATRAPSRSNSCAVASPIPLLPPVIRIFLSVSLPIVASFRIKHIRISYIFRQNSTDSTHQLRETRFAESLLHSIVRSVKDWAEPLFHRAGYRASFVHLAAHGKNTRLAFNRLVDLTKRYARCRALETHAALTALTKNDQSLTLEEFEDLPHHDRVGLEAFRDHLRSRSPVTGVSDERHDMDGTGHTTVNGHKHNNISYNKDCRARAACPISTIPAGAGGAPDDAGIIAAFLLNLVQSRSEAGRYESVRCPDAPLCPAVPSTPH